MTRGVTLDDVRAVALALPRAYEVLVRDRVKFRVGPIVFVAFSQDETVMGFGYPKEERAGLVESDPETYLMPTGGNLRYRWVEARMARLEHDVMTEYVQEAWRMVVPKRLAAAHLGP